MMVADWLVATAKKFNCIIQLDLTDDQMQRLSTAEISFVNICHDAFDFVFHIDAHEFTIPFVSPNWITFDEIQVWWAS